MEIVDFRPDHANAFGELNIAWISRLVTLEPKDHAVLDDPQGAILAKGGRIFMALDGDDAVGCVAMIRMADGGFEVARMTVAEGLRGAGFGRRLMQRCIDEGRAAGAARLFLETNSALAPALALYRSMGYRQMGCDERPATDYQRCDVCMEPRLQVR